MANRARSTLLLAPCAFLLPGCGDSTPAGPTEADQANVQAASDEIAKKFAPSAKAVGKSPQGARR